MTLKELQSKIEKTIGKTLPTAAWLRAGNSPLVVNRELEDDTRLSVYQNGFALYQTEVGSTVFRVDCCGGYTYFGRNEQSELSEDFFASTDWWVRLLIEGEDRLTHNQTSLAERHESLYETSMDTAADTEDFLKNIILREMLEAAFSLMTERQREIVVMYYIDGMGVKEIAAIYGITHQAVSVTLSDVKKKFRKNRDKFL